MEPNHSSLPPHIPKDSWSLQYLKEKRWTMCIYYADVLVLTVGHLQSPSECQSFCLYASNTWFQCGCQEQSVRSLEHHWHQMLGTPFHTDQYHCNRSHDCMLALEPLLQICFSTDRSRGKHMAFASRVKQKKPSRLEQNNESINMLLFWCLVNTHSSIFNRLLADPHLVSSVKRIWLPVCFLLKPSSFSGCNLMRMGNHNIPMATGTIGLPVLFSEASNIGPVRNSIMGLFAVCKKRVRSSHSFWVYRQTASLMQSWLIQDMTRIKTDAAKRSMHKT